MLIILKSLFVLCALTTHFINAQDDSRYCPQLASDSVGTCDQKCNSDKDCGPEEKCCSNGCGNRCTTACVKVACKCPFGTTFFVDKNGCEQCTCNPETNPCAAILCITGSNCVVDPKTNKGKCVPIGVCPVNPPGVITPCVVGCPSDESCAVGEKCCPYGCTNTCRKICPAPVCPTSDVCLLGTITEVDKDTDCTVCKCNSPCVVAKCSNDSVCQVDPLTGKAVCVPITTCPSYDFVRCSSILKHECTSDDDCPQPQKCCANPCIRTCVEPCITDVSQCKCEVGIPVLLATGPGNCKRCSCENPCQFANCRGRCIVKQVNCTPAPCRPVAECLPNRCEKGFELPNVFCGRGPNRVDCPSNYSCLIARDDRFAVCCPDQDPCKGLCKRGQRCVLQDVQCLVPPCAPVPKCLPRCRRSYNCDNTCLNGYAYDKNGCRTCACYEE